MTITDIHEQLAPSSESIILGDFQCFPNIPKNLTTNNNVTRLAATNILSKYLSEFIDNNNFIPIDITNGTGPLYTYQHPTMTNQSYIDHILTSYDLQSCSSNTAVIQPDPLNTGDHLPVTTTITLSHDTTQTQHDNFTDFQYVPNYMWNNSKFIAQYNDYVSKAASNLLNKSASPTEDFR